MGSAEELGGAIAAVVAEAGAGVVGIGPGWGLGSGVVLTEGQVLTNAHNVPGDEVSVRFADGRSATGRITARDVDGDLAVIAVDTGQASPISWDGHSTVSIGTPVVALANPGGRGLRATIGFISATERTFRGPRGRRVRGALEHTAPMARGSSGGPLVALDGHLLGVNTHRLGEGFYLARPAGQALRERIDALARGESPRRRRLGVALAPDGAARRLRAAVGLPEHDGVLVHAVEDDGPADRAGLRRGDLLIAAGARPLTRTDDLIEALDAAEEQLPLTLLRGTERVEVTVPLEERPS
jgi:serine protease Do